MTADENYDSKFDTEEPPFEKITINTDYKIKTSLEEPLTDLELKPLPNNLEYVFLEEPSFLPVIISSQLSFQNKSKLVSVLQKHKEAFAWKTTDIDAHLSTKKWYWLIVIFERVRNLEALELVLDHHLLDQILINHNFLIPQVPVLASTSHSTNPKLSKRFEKLMHNKFEISMMGELKFFLGIQIYQSPLGIFINQVKYAQKILKNHGMTSCDSIGTPMATKPLDVDLNGTPVDQTKYRSMVGSLMYLKASRPDIVHAPCYYARYQARPIEKHLKEVKQIFRYLKNTIHMGLWYLKDTGFNLTAFSNPDHVGCLDTRKSTSGGIQFLGGNKLLSWSSKKQDRTSMSTAKAKYVSLSACCVQVLLMRTQLTDYGFHFNKIPMHYDSKAAIAISCNPV
ncbi:retrovirus-related pol polyprotein from transposon TNT 1-94 [Tanacetum coccineum]